VQARIKGLGGLTQADELRHLLQAMGVDSFVCEFNITQGLWTSRVTSHVLLCEMAELITEQGIGDGGSIGREEIDLIAPAVQRLQATGLDARRPYSPDTVFIAARRGDFDAVVSMYHVQGQIAMKLMGFERGVTLHGGLPVPVATSASGSA
jgi:4-hydroxythreonine-4-phosphate dehydrogenase